MGYILLRISIVLATLLVLFLLIVKKWINKTAFFALLAMVVGLSLILCNTPFENSFFTFSSPQEVFDYAKQGELIDTVEGVDSVAMISKENNTYSIFFAKKVSDGYKIMPLKSISKQSIKQWDSINLCIYRISGTDDFYLRVWGVTENEIVFSDCQNSDFSPIYEDFSNKKIVNCVAIIDYEDGYYCSLDGNPIVFD